MRFLLAALVTVASALSLGADCWWQHTDTIHMYWDENNDGAYDSHHIRFVYELECSGTSEPPPPTFPPPPGGEEQPPPPDPVSIQIDSISDQNPYAPTVKYGITDNASTVKLYLNGSLVRTESPDFSIRMPSLDSIEASRPLSGVFNIVELEACRADGGCASESFSLRRTILKDSTQPSDRFGWFVATVEETMAPPLPFSWSRYLELDYEGTVYDIPTEGARNGKYWYSEVHDVVVADIYSDFGFPDSGRGWASTLAAPWYATAYHSVNSYGSTQYYRWSHGIGAFATEGMKWVTAELQTTNPLYLWSDMTPVAWESWDMDIRALKLGN